MHLVVLLFALFASLFTLQKETLNYTEPFFLVGSRMAFAGILLISYLAITNKNKLIIKLNHVPTLIGLGLLNIYLTNIFEIWAINLTISSKVCLIYSLSPFLAALVAFVVLRERLSIRKFIGMCIGFVGLLPILFARSEHEVTSSISIGFFSAAESLAIGAVFCSVSGWILLKKLIIDYKYSPLAANGISMFLGGSLALMHSYLSGEAWQPIPVNDLKPFISYSLVMCLISNVICYNLYGFLLRKFTATFMSFSGLITPLFASLFGYIFLGESITWHFVGSIILFSIGLSIFYQEEIRQGEAYRVQVA